MKNSNKKKCTIMLFMVLLAFVITACQSKKENTIVVATNPEFAPFEYVNDEGEVDGFDVALIYAISDEIGYDIEFSSMEFKSILGAIQTDGVDAAISGMTITEDRLKSVDFSDPYYNATQCIILPKDNDDIKSLTDLNGKKIAVQEGTTGDLFVTYTEENEIITDSDTKVKRFKKGTDAVLELLNDGVDAVVIDAAPAKNFVAKNDDKLKYIADETTVEQYGIAVAKGNDELVKKLNEGLANVVENGTYDELVDQYINNSGTVAKVSSDNFFVNIYQTFKYVFFDTNGYSLLLKGLWRTIYISILAIILGVILGFILALMKLTEVRKGKKTFWSVLAGAYIDIFRGTPVMVQLLIMYMIIFQNKFSIVAAFVTFGLNSGAYVAEIIRAGIMAVDNGQMEGGRSLGFSYGRTMRYIIIPQAIKNILPALCNEFIALIKETSIVGYVAVQDLTKAADFIISRTYETFMPLIVIAIVYYVLIKLLTKLFGVLERRLRRSDIR